jgi:predicted AlkP superfamily phosphohydrolase/phosphomutase
VLVIGLDMGDGRLIRHWSGMGRLRHLAALQTKGVSLHLDSTAEVLHTSTWPTFATGTLPGIHGVYYPYQPRPGHQLAQHIEPNQYGAECFWKTASAHGRRALVYDVPETFPDPAFSGHAIFDWGTWAWYGEPTAQPGELLDELKARFGRYPLGLEAKRLAFRVPERIESRLVDSVRYKAVTSKWLLERAEWDLAVIGLCETHPGGHYLWPAGADDAGACDDARFESLFRVYAAIDDAIGALQASVPSNTTVVVVSGDGVRPNRCGWHLLPRILERLISTTTEAPSPRSAGEGGSLVGRAQGLIPVSAKKALTAALPWRVRDRLGVWLQTRSIDWSRTRAFTLPTDLEGCIRINLKGREPLGIISTAAEYDNICAEIRRGLEDLENPATGGRVVRDVWIRNEIFPGPRREHLPDVIVTWNDDAPINAVVSPRVGLIEGVNPDPRPGTHSRSGFAIAAGPHISPGTVDRAHLADVAASVLTLLGVDTSTLDGRPIAALTSHTKSGRVTASSGARPADAR